MLSKEIQNKVVKAKIPVSISSLELATHEMKKIKTKFYVLLKDEVKRKDHDDPTGALALLSSGYAQSTKYLGILEDCEKDQTDYFLETVDIAALSTTILTVHDVEKTLKKYNISIVDH